MPKPTIFILTATYRDANLGKLAVGIRGLTGLFNVHWFPVMDTVFGNWHAGAKYNIGMDLVSRILTRMPLPEAQNSWLYFLDDDNLIHEEFGQALLNAISSRPEDQWQKTMFLMRQYLPSGNLRLDNVHVGAGSIDTGCMIPNAAATLNPALRWRLADASTGFFDYAFADRLVVKGEFEAVLVDGKTYYNAISGRETGGRGFDQNELNRALKLEEEMYGPA